MIVTRGFEKSPEIYKEITLELNERKEFMCLRRRKLPLDITISLPEKPINLRDYEQIPFETKEDFLRNVLDNIVDTKPEKTQRISSSIGKLPEEEKIRFPLVHFNITQVVQNNRKIKRSLPNISFNMRSWNDYPIRAKVKARVFLDNKDLGLVKGSRRGGKYMGYYDGNLLWNLNPYSMIFGNFNVPNQCITTNENLRIEVTVTLVGIDGTDYDLLPVSWTFMRDRNEWFFEPTGDC